MRADTKSRATAVPAQRSSIDLFFRRIRSELFKNFRREAGLEELNRALAEREVYFRSPPLDKEMIAAVKLITPQFHLRSTENSRRVWELSQNGSAWAEYLALESVLSTFPKPKRVLDIGPGLGRSTVFFKKKLDWDHVPFDLYEANGDRTDYTRLGDRTANSFCGNIACLKRVLEFNGVANWTVHDAASLDFRLDHMPGPYDLLYSFYGIGFHWSLEDYWEDLQPLLHDDSLAVFTVPDAFEPSEALQRTGFAFARFERILANAKPLRLLLVSRNAELLAAAHA